MKSIKKNAILNTLKIITGLYVALFFGINNTLADEIETITTFPETITSYQFLNDVMCQEFTPVNTSLTSIDVQLRNSSSNNTGLSLELCKGSLISTTTTAYSNGYGAFKVMNCPGATKIFQSIFLQVPVNTTPQGTKVNIPFVEKYVSTGDTYYFCIDEYNQNESVYLISPITSTYGGRFYNDNSITSSYDLYFTINSSENGYVDQDVEIYELPEFTGNIQIGAETLIEYNRHNFCFLGSNEECHLKFNYGYDAIGAKILLTTKSGEFVASTTVEDKYLLQDRFVIQEPLSAQTQEYCIAIDTGEDILTYCDITLEWISNPWCSEEVICAEVATSSDFLYGIQCGLRRTMCWVFQPTQSSISFLTKTIDNFTNTFPFNLPFDFVKQIDYSIETASSSKKSFGLPMYSEETQGFYIVNGINPGMYYEILGTSTVNTLENQADMVLWLLVSLLIVYIIWKFAIHKK